MMGAHQKIARRQRRQQQLLAFSFEISGQADLTAVEVQNRDEACGVVGFVLRIREISLEKINGDNLHLATVTHFL